MAKTRPEASKTCFVIMPFRRDQSLQEVYELAIKPAVVLAGFRCIRADEITDAGLILEHIVKTAYEADVVIADITGNNANVLYELGLAHGFAKTVVVLSQDDEAPFDLKAYRIVSYKPTIAGADKLQKDIRAALEATLSPSTTNRTNPVRLFIPTLKDKAEAVEICQQIAKLEEDNKKLEGMRDLAQSIIDTLGGRASLEQIQTDMESDAGSGSVTIDLQNDEAGRPRLTFKKLDKRERVILPPRKRS